jgi:transitional endoplasmic reticulum ATPase
MKVEITFPLSPVGVLRKAAAIASRHSSYRISGRNGDARAAVELELPDDWREYDRLRRLLRSESSVEYAADGEPVPAEELADGLRCFLRKQRSGTEQKDWCTPPFLNDRQIFPCKKIHVYDNDRPTSNSWYSFGAVNESGVFEVDKAAISERVLGDLGPCVRCPILDLDSVAETVARLPEEIDPARDPRWSYRNGGSGSLGVAKTREGEEDELDEEDRETLLERLARTVRSGSAGAVGNAVRGAPGSRNVPATRYEDIGGMKETIALVREAVELPITHPEIFRRLKIRPHKGILFYGPPGTGKTLLARAVANESGAHFIAVSGPEILNKFWGQSEARLRGIFAEAKAKSPSIILFDEIDSFASARDMMSESFEATLVSQLLSLMDGMNDLGRVCVIATTNRPSALDPALRRPGRFDHEIEIGLPDRDARLHILKIHTRGMPLAPELDLEEIAAITRDYTGADLEALCREAALVCMRRTLDLRDFARKIPNHRLSTLSVTGYDFRAATKRVGPSIRR